VLGFKRDPRAFLILDGQHRVYGFKKAKAKLRVPVVIYNNLKKADEARLFIDINTKQRPVPNELLLDIKRMAETETDVEALLRDVFDAFASEKDSPLIGLMSPSTRSSGKISRVTFNAGLRSIWNTFAGNKPEFVYQALSAYIRAWLPALRDSDAEGNITNPTLFRAIMMLFPAVAEKVSDRHGEEYSVENFNEILGPFFARLKKSTLKNPGVSIMALHDTFKNALQSGFAIGRGRKS
jgi:DGQHR domain-containing protein